MNNKTKTNFKKGVVNFFGALGYFFCSILIFWTIILYSNLIGGVAEFLSTDTKSHVVQTTSVVGNSGESIIQTIAGIVILIATVAFTIYILIKIPSAMAKASKKVVHEAADGAMPIVLRMNHKQDTKKNRLTLTSRLVVIMKIVLITASVILAFGSQFLEKQFIDFDIAILVSLWLACLCTILFGLQYLMARLLFVKNQDLW